MWGSIRQWLGRVIVGHEASRGDARPAPVAASRLSPEQQGAVDGNTALIRKTFADLTGSDYPPGREGVRYLDGFIERTRPNLDADACRRMGTITGCYLGASLIAAFGGEWVRDAAGLGVRSPNGEVAYPINKATKQWQSGDGDSVLAFFETTGALWKR